MSVDWTDSADVDVAIYDGNIKVLASDGTANKPAKRGAPFRERQVRPRCVRRRGHAGQR